MEGKWRTWEQPGPNKSGWAEGEVAPIRERLPDLPGFRCHFCVTTYSSHCSSCQHCAVHRSSAD